MQPQPRPQEQSPITIQTTCGRTIACNYLDHPAYSPSLNICLSLHYVFTSYGPTVTYASVYLLRSAINTFFDFMEVNNSNNPPPLHITNYIHITHETFFAYQRFIRKLERPIDYADKLRSAMSVAAQLSEVLPPIALPAIERDAREKTEPLFPDAYAQLTQALISHIDTLRSKITFREKLANVEPYEYEGVLKELTPTFTRADIFRWYQCYAQDSSRQLKKDKLFQKLRYTNDPELIHIGMLTRAVPAFKELYEDEASAYLLDVPFDPTDAPQGMYQWRPDDLRALKTLISHDYPFHLPLPEIATTYARKGIQTLKQCDNVVKLILHRYTICNRTDSNIRLPMLDDLLSEYFPTAIDISAIVLFLMLQSGWNKESVLSLDQENFEHVLTGAIGESLAVIFSEKNKSQSTGKPYFDPKQIVAQSDKNDPYSIFNLIELAKTLTEPLRDKSFDVMPVSHDDESMNRLFCFLRPWGEWGGLGGRHSSISNQKSFMQGIRAFLSAYPIFENGRRLEGAKDLTRRLRPTWEHYKRKDHPLSFLSTQMGHSNVNTTDIYYDSSGIATQGRKGRLRSELEAIVSLLRARQFTGLLGNRAQKDAAAELKIFTIPGQENALWGCANQLSPDWIGAARYITPGKKCCYIQHCLGCSQIRVFEESLPFLIERLAHIEEQLEGPEATRYMSGLEIEKQIIEYILDQWGDDDAVRLAARYQRKHNPLLPRDLASLRILFDEGQFDEGLLDQAPPDRDGLGQHELEHRVIEQGQLDEGQSDE